MANQPRMKIKWNSFLKSHFMQNKAGKEKNE